MTKNEFLTKLSHELGRRNVADAADVANEYEQHFSFKLADGYTEEEIAARLGDPSALAAQFDGASVSAGGRKVVTVIGLCFTDLFAGIFFTLLAAWQIVMAACIVAFTALAVCLVGGLNTFSMIPEMPYGCAVVFGIALLALAALSAVGSIYYGAFLKQLMRAFGRFHSNALASASGKATLPPIAVSVRLCPKAKRRLRTVVQISMAVFATAFMLAYVICAVSAGSLEFWHAWGWFNYSV